MKTQTLRFPGRLTLLCPAVLAIALASSVATAQTYSLVDDFESYTSGTWSGGTTAASVWTTNTGGTTGLVAIENDGTTKHLAFGWNAGVRGAWRLVPDIVEGGKGTYHFKIRTTDATPDASFGLSDSAAPTVFVDFEVQVGLADDGNSGNGLVNLIARSGPDFQTIATGLSVNAWYDVWVSVDNASDTYDVYYGTSGNPAVLGTLAASGLAFRNGTTSTINKFWSLSNLHGDRQAHLDEIYHAPVALVQPGSEVVANDDAIEVGVSGSLQFDARANDSGFYDLANIEIVSPPTSGNAKVDPGSGRLIYTHSGSAAGSDSFTYRIGDSSWSDVDEATVEVAISGGLRIDNVTAMVPAEAPIAAAGELVIVDGLPGLNFPGAVAMSSIPGSPKQLLVASVNGSVWWVPDSTLPSPSRYEILNAAQLSNFNNGRSIYSMTCFPDPVSGAGNLDIILTYQGDNNRLPTGGVSGLDENGVTKSESDIDCDLRISRFTLSSTHFTAVQDGLSMSENQAVLATEFPYLNLAEQHDFHSINDAKFHWDSSDSLRKYYLYVSFGDEGSQGSPYWNTQKITKDQFSSIICIDLNPASTNPKPNPHYAIPVGPLNYSGGSTAGVHDVANTVFSNPATQSPNFRVPLDNPFVHTSKGGAWDGIFNGKDYTPSGLGMLGQVRDEMWAIGTRNPFKICVDWGADTGDTVVIYGDVGKSDREEFTLIRSGENGGWGYYEGDIVAPGMSEDPALTAPTQHSPPIYSYGRGMGNSATGGIIYRRPELSVLTDRYVCADFGSGRIWSMNYLDGSSRIEHTQLRQSGNKIVDFQLDDASGDIFVLENDTWSGGSARVLRITLQGAGEDYPQALSELGIFADFADPSGNLIPNAGVLPYQPNLKFWSDGADKARWFIMPDGSSTIGYSEDEPWTFPAGMLTVKHFDYDFGGNVVRLETRVMRYDGADTYGVSYRWNEAGTEATLVPTDGLAISFDASGAVTSDPGASVLNWNIPSRSECMTCHNPGSGYLLSLNSRQLNREHSISGQTGNQLSLYSAAGILNGLSADPASLPHHLRPDEASEDLEARVRSYLDVNCAYCHQPGGNVPPGSWDGRAHVPLTDTGILYGSPVSEGVHHTEHVVVRPGQEDGSIMWNRINARRTLGEGTYNGETQMPPIATNVVDAEGVALLEAWIQSHANVAPAVPATLTVDEGSAIGASLLAALASDPDIRSGVADQDQLSYSISGGNAGGFFALDGLTGEVTVTGWLDFEKSPSHSFEVTVSDNFAPNPMSTVAQVSVVVNDLEPEDGNDNSLPDVWESFYGLTGGNSVVDHDGDGVASFFELLGGSDPSLSSSTPEGAIISVMPAGPAAPIFSWRQVNGMVPGIDYLIKGSITLGSGSWNDLVAGEDYELVSELPDGIGYRRISIRLLSDSARNFVRLTSP